MADQWANIQFDVSTEILGSDAEFHDGSSERLGPERTDDKIFRIQTGQLLDTREMISYLLAKTNTRKQDLIKPAAAAEAFEKGVCVGKPSLDMSFTPGSCELWIGDTRRDIKRIVFDVEMTVRPKKSS
jgi:hypothetical protein